MNTGELLHRAGASGYAKNRALLLANPSSKVKMTWSQKNITRNCVKCSQMGYHSNVFENAWCVTCPIHDLPLRSQCSTCGRRWPPLPYTPKPSCTTCGADIPIDALGQAGAFSKGHPNHDVLHRLQEIDLRAVGTSDYLYLDHDHRGSYAVYPSHEAPHTSAPFLSLVKAFPSHWDSIVDLGIETFTTARILSDTVFYMRAKKDGDYTELSSSLRAIAASIFTALSAICAELCFCNRRAAAFDLLHGGFTFCPHCAALASWSATFTDDGILESYRRGLTWDLNSFCSAAPQRRGHYHFELLDRAGSFYVTTKLLRALYIADILSAYEELLDSFFRVQSRNTTTNSQLHEKPRDLSSRKMVALYVLHDGRLALTKPRYLSSIDTFKQFIASNYSRK